MSEGEKYNFYVPTLVNNYIKPKQQPYKTKQKGRE